MCSNFSSVVVFKKLNNNADDTLKQKIASVNARHDQCTTNCMPFHNPLIFAKAQSLSHYSNMLCLAIIVAFHPPIFSDSYQ